MVTPKKRDAGLEMTPEEFASLGHEVVDIASNFLQTLPARPVTHGESPSSIRKLLGSSGLPQGGSDARYLLKEVSELLVGHSLFNGHPRFWGYITSSAAPIGAMGDFLASVVNPNVGAYSLSPVAT